MHNWKIGYSEGYETIKTSDGRNIDTTTIETVRAPSEEMALIEFGRKAEKEGFDVCDIIFVSKLEEE